MMSGFIHKFIDTETGKVLLPLTVSDAVLDDSGRTLTEILASLPSQSSSDLTQVAEDGFFLCDANGSIVVKITQDGLDCAHFVYKDFKGLQEKVIELDDALKTQQEEINQLKEFANNQHIGYTEKKVGTIEIMGQAQELFERTVDLNDLPNTIGQSKEYVIADEPLGFNLYLSIDRLSVSSGMSKLSGTFFQSRYQVEDVFVDESLKTMLKISCIKDAPAHLRAVVTLSYVKFFGEMAEFSVTLPEGINPDDVNLSFPKLKFNKKLLITNQTDDGAASFYGANFSYTNKKWIEESVTFYHKDQDKIAGYYPERTLHFTDAAGTERRFTHEITAWPHLKDTGTGEYWFLKDAGRFTPWCNAKDLLYAIDFGNDVCFHDVADENGIVGGGDNETEEGKVAQIEKGIDHCQVLFKQFLNGYGVKALAQPAGSDVYTKAARRNDNVVLISLQTGKNTFYMRDDWDISKESGFALNRLFRGGITDNNSDEYYMERFRTIRNLPDDEKYWFCWLVHESYKTQLSLLDNIMDEFGAAGDDSVWFTTANEVYEWWFLRNNTGVVKMVDGNKVTFRLLLPAATNFHHPELSVFLSGIATADGVAVESSDNCYGTTYALNELTDNNFMINLNCDAKLLERAQRYTRMFEQSGDMQSDYEDAMYFIQQLKQKYREPLKERIDNKLAG